MATYPKIKRSKMAVFMNTAKPSTSTATYNITGINISELTINYNPQTTTQQDITQDTASTDVTGYQPNISVTGTASQGDPVFEFVNNIRRTRAVLGDATTDIVIVDIFDGNKAEKQPVTIQLDSYGGSAEEPLTLSYTINYSGDATQGTFDPVTKTFTVTS